MSRPESANPVRSQSRMVVDEAEHVSLNQENVPDFCDFLIDEYEFETADWDAPVFPSIKENEIEDVADYMFVGNALNYCFNDMETGDKFAYEFIGTEWSGAFGMWAAMMDYYRDNEELLETRFLKSITVEQVEDIFEPSNGVKLPMIKSRVKNLRSVGQLMEKFDGSLWNIFEDGSVRIYGQNGIVSTLANSESYEDKRTYKGQTVRFDKRAQLAVSMLYGKLIGTEYEFEITDMKKFTVFADYGIPAGLATHRIIEYDSELSERVQEQDIVQENSPEEVEIRASTVVAVERIQRYLKNNYNVDATIPVLDYVLWRMRKDADTNVHLTETTAY